MKQRITHERLLAVLFYDESTGLFTWRQRVAKCVHVGSVAGRPNGHGYRIVNIDKVCYLVHRLAWFYVHGSWPNGDIDHINGDQTDNRIANLRVVTESENMHNRKGVLGYTRTRYGRFQAHITLNRKQHCLGTFETEAEARAAYLAAKKILHPSAPPHMLV